MNFTVYKSSAGSGKTFTLVKEYLRLALADEAKPPRRYREILAITFTNKAAAEMKERIISALEELSAPQQGKLSVMSELLSKELSLDPFTLASRSRDILRAILHNYTDFAIGTIDSFTHRIVRAFAHDLHLPVNFEVETDANKIIQEAVDVLISRIGEDEKLTEILVRFSENRADDEKNWQIERGLRDIAKQLLEEEGSRNAEKLRKLSLDDFISIRDKLNKSTSVFRENIIGITAELFRQINGAGLVAEDFAYGKNGIYGRIKNYAEGDLDKFTDENSNISKMIASGKFYSGKVSASAKQAIESLQPLIETSWARLEKMREEESGRYLIRTMLQKNIYALAVLNEIEKIIFSFRTEDSIVHISEFNRIISRVVFEEPVPFIYERLGEKYTNYLIDEFQDTSVTQWQNLLPLIDNSLAGNHFSMLVGDGKQAIYRWRGGEVEQFAQLPKITLFSDNPLVKDREQSLQRNYSEKHLGKNFRSKAEIVSFNNEFFRNLSGLLSPAHQLIYDKLEQEYNESNTGGYIRIEALDLDAEDEDFFVHKTIEQVVALEKEGIPYRDICVLTRTNREGSQIASALLTVGIPVLSSESLLLKQSPAVNFLVCMLRCIDHPHDELASARALEFLVSSGKMQQPLHSRLIEFQESQKKIDLVLTKNGFDFKTDELSRLPIYQRCEELISIFKLTDGLDSYLLFFLDEILNFNLDRNPGKKSFSEWWEDRSNKASVVVPEGMNAVNMMTIHKSKGLEFPVVILPFANWKFKKGRDELWVDLNDPAIPEMTTALIPASEKLLKTDLAEAYEEEISKSRLDIFNVLYVAMTRPENRLYVYTAKSKKRSSDPKNLEDIFAFALEKMGMDSGSDLFEKGQPLPVPYHDPATENYIRPSVLHSVKWKERIRIRSQAIENWDMENPGGKREKGLLFHKLLAEIETADQIEKAIQNLLASGFVSASEIDLLRAEAETLVQLPELKDCFSSEGKSKREIEILMPDGRNLRPDRVVQLNEKTVILDYKTGNPDAAHRKQLDNYADALGQMGYKSIEKKLVYTETMTVESW